MYKYKYEKKNRSFARRLRRRETKAEKVLWYYLRARRLEGLKFRRQFPIGNYILDFYCSEEKLAVEVDGSQHAEDANREQDDQRKEYLRKHGIEVLRFWNNEVFENIDGVLHRIVEQISP